MPKGVRMNIKRKIGCWLRSKHWYRKWRGLPEPVTPLAAMVTREALRILILEKKLVFTQQGGGFVLVRKWKGPTNDE